MHKKNIPVTMEVSEQWMRHIWEQGRTPSIFTYIEFICNLKEVGDLGHREEYALQCLEDMDKDDISCLPEYTRKNFLEGLIDLEIPTPKMENILRTKGFYDWLKEDSGSDVKALTIKLALMMKNRESFDKLIPHFHMNYSHHTFHSLVSAAVGDPNFISATEAFDCMVRSGIGYFADEGEQIAQTINNK